MKRSALVFIFVFLFAAYAYAASRGSIPVTQEPVVMETRGEQKTINLDAAIYPEFENIIDDGGHDPLCSPKCVDSDSNKCVFKRLSGAPIMTPSTTLVKPEGQKSVAQDDPKFQDELGLRATDLTVKLKGKIPAAYSKTAKILVSWTLRVEGTCPTWEIGKICYFWVGTVTFVCNPKNVVTSLRATYDYDPNGNPRKERDLGVPVALEMPRSTNKETQVDPTLAGTYLITADDFPDKQIPSDLELTVFWENKSAFQISSRAGFRNMIVHITPYSKKDK